MGEEMKDWDQKQVENWIGTISTLSDNVKKQIIAGITQYSKDNEMPVTGKDLSEAEKEDLKGICGIDGMMAGRLLTAIQDRLDAEFDDNLNRNGGGGKRKDNDITNDRFTLNFIGANVQSINIKHIEKTMKIREVKSLYLIEYGDETSAHKYASAKWGANEKEKISFKYNSKPMANDKTLQYYDCTDGLLPICVVFRVMGGADNANESDVYKSGDDVLYKFTDKKSNGSANWVNAKVCGPFPSGCIQIVFEMPGTGTKAFEVLLKREIADVLRPSDQTKIDQTKNDQTENGTENEENDTENEENDTEMSENKNDKQNDTENKKDKQLYDKIEFKENDKIKLLLDSNEWVDGKILTILGSRIEVQCMISNKLEIDHIDIDKKNGWQKRIKLIKIKNEPLSWNEKLMSEWSKRDVECWVNSVPAFKRYAKEFGKIMDGKELLDTTSDDLISIISSKLVRRKFMEKLQSAKQKYHILYSAESASDDEKISKSNGVIGLNNMGNTCFLNTSIQLLSQSPYLSRYLKKRAKSHSFVSAKNAGFANWRTMKKCVSSRSTDAWNKQSEIRNRPMLNAWTDLCDIIYNQPAKNGKSNYVRIHRPSDILNALNNIDSDFGSGEQDDSVRSLTIMLQALDSEIEEEINQNKLDNNGKSIKAIEYMDKYQLYHGNTLSVSDENKIVAKLVSKHNPNNSIVRKIFDGIERLIYECLHCNKIFQQYVVFRDIDLPVSSNDVSFSNVTIVFNNTCGILPTCTLVDYCSIDVLKYHIIQYLQTENKIDIRDIDVVTMSNTGKIKQFDNKNKLSSLQQSNDNIFVLVNNNHSNSQCASPPARLLQFKLFIDKRQQSELAQCKYIKYDQNDICKLINDEIEQKNNNNGKYIVHYNGKLLDPKVKIYNKNIHHLNQDINVLFLLCIDGENNTLNFDITNIDALLCKQAKEKRHSRNMLDALHNLKQSKQKQKQTFIDDGLPQLQDTFKEAVNSELIRLSRTINEFEKKEKINNFIKTWIKTSFHSKASKSKPLTNINECLAEYQKTMIMDNNVFSYKCVHCNRDCKWTKIRKTIVYTPPILTLHLDRFGKNRKQTYQLNGTSMSYAFTVGDRVRCKWMGNDADRGTFYSATISYVESNGVRVRFDGYGKERFIASNNYSQQIRPNENTFDSYNNSYGSNKFNHCIQYQRTLNINKGEEVYDLYAISNHSGTTKGGHYTATVKSLSDNKWYNISDANVNYRRASPLKNEKSATILMYSREQQ